MTSQYMREQLAEALGNIPPKDSTREDYKKYILAIGDVDPTIIASDIARWINRSFEWVSDLLWEARRERETALNIGAFI